MSVATMQFPVLMTTLITSFICGLVRARKLDIGSAVMLILIGVSLITEGAGHYCAVKFKTNTAVYNLYSLLEFLLVFLYFNYTIDVFERRSVGWYIGFFGAFLGTLNLIFLQSLDIFGSNFLFFEGITIIIASLFGLFRFFLKEQPQKIFRYAHFWFISILLVYWSVSFLNFGFYELLRNRFPSQIWVISFIIWCANIFTYMGFATVFLLYPKLQKNDG